MTRKLDISEEKWKNKTKKPPKNTPMVLHWSSGAWTKCQGQDFISMAWYKTRALDMILDKRIREIMTLFDAMSFLFGFQA